jgi:hypothetical protein
MHVPPPILAPSESSVAMPREFKDFRGYHSGGTLLVCGCGSSLSQLLGPQRLITIGVNDVGRLFDPDYLVVLNPRQQFTGDRFHYVEQSRAKAIFTQLDLGISHPHLVRFRLGRRGGTDVSDLNSLPYTRNSPYLALCLAVYMGARRIGLIGVDFTDNHFFAATGRHSLAGEFAQIDREYRQLQESCSRRGVEILNLSRESRLTAFPKIAQEDFMQAGLSRRSADAVSAAAVTTSISLATAEPKISVEESVPVEKPGAFRIVSYATTPVAGVPGILSRCIAARSPHECRTVWATNTYGNGVSFEGDVEWRRAPSVAEDLLQSADLVIVHNGKVEPQHQRFLHQKPIVTMAHNYIWNVDTTFVQQGFPGVVVGQYQATLAEFKGWEAVPNPMPLWEAAYQPGQKEQPITICYTPSGKHESYAPGHRLYWHSKGYATTIRILDNLARRFPLRLEVVREKQFSHSESLAMKRRAHIVIDECVTGSYHRNSLEGLACGCVVVNGVGKLPAVREMFRHCAEHPAEVPFVYAGLDDLEKILVALIEKGPDALVALGGRNRTLMEEHWDFTRQWEQFWEPVVKRAVAHERERRRAGAISTGPQCGGGDVMLQDKMVKQLKTGLSAVICHGGQERLRHLGASLTNLRQCNGVNEIIVVDMGTSPYAEDVARRWADKYIFVRTDDVFERARSLNIGTALAEYDLVLWRDNDLIMPRDFPERAVVEMRARNLDYMFPHTCIHYLSAQDSQDVMRGTRSPADCAPVRVLRPIRENCGAAGLVKKAFVLSNGGIPEDFRGWGGEDDAWWFKAQLLGRAEVSQRRDQILYHLFHPNSGGYGGSGQIATNPYYSKNVAVLREIRSVRDPRVFLERFPPSLQFSLAQESKRVLFLTESRDGVLDPADKQVAEVLARLLGNKVECRTANGNDISNAVGEHLPDAIVLFSKTEADRFLTEKSREEVWPRTIVFARNEEMPEATLRCLHNAAAVCVTECSSAEPLRRAGIRPWVRPPAHGDPNLADALTLLQPLSIVLGGSAPVKSTGMCPPPEGVSSVRDEDLRGRLPVWMYWEGSCPEWIKQCHKTVFAHYGNARLLSPADFDALRDQDREIDVKALHVAHRADYVRAFLLARYGGMWVDSDCLVMKPLRPVLDKLLEYDFVAHRERSGYISNAFIAARSGSQIASALYKRICQTLRSRRPLGWISLGGEALTEILNTAPAPWHEIECETVQPICWSNPGAFFARKSCEGHSRDFDARAICYMLSNTEIQRFQAKHPSHDLLTQDTFFSYLVDRALQSNGKEQHSIETSTDWQQSSFSGGGVFKASAHTVLSGGSDVGRGGTAVCERSEESGASIDPNSLTEVASCAPVDVEVVFERMVRLYKQMGDESISGPGSSLEHTSEIRERLPLLIEDLQVQKLLDAACGDFNWMKQIRLGVDQYLGVDALSTVIAQNQKAYASSKRRFLCLDISHDSLPEADLILCRDCLVHHSYENVFRVLRNFRRSKSEYLLTTTFVRHRANSDIVTGEWRPLNLQLPPFDFPPPLRAITEKCQENGGRYSDKSLGLWRIENLHLPKVGSAE